MKGQVSVSEGERMVFSVESDFLCLGAGDNQKQLEGISSNLIQLGLMNDLILVIKDQKPKHIF